MEVLFVLFCMIVLIVGVGVTAFREGERAGFQRGVNEGYTLGVQRSEEFARQQIMELLQGADAELEAGDDGHS